MSLSALSVLVVEDHGFQRRMALRLLAELGIARLHEAGDGHSALRLLRALAQAPDVVMVDLDMPGMDGIEFIDHLAQERLARSILVASALDAALLHTVQTMARACGLHVLEAVPKPLTRAKLAQALAGLDHAVDAAADEDPGEISPDSARAALDHNDIQPWFQPQVELGNGQVIGAGMQLSVADASTAPANQAPARLMMRVMALFRISASAQATTGSRATTLARPKNCMKRSAKAAPV